jgi:hypothetical protein
VFQVLPLILIILVVTILEPRSFTLNMARSTSSYSALTSPSSSFREASSLTLSSSDSSLLLAFSFLIYVFFIYYTMHISFRTYLLVSDG